MINDLFYIKDKAIHCTTKKLALEILSILDSMGYKWITGSSLLKEPSWEFFESNTYYSICENKRIVYGDISDMKPNDILTAEWFINLYKNNNNMQKSDLKSGMSIKLRNGQIGLIVDVFGTKIIQYENNWNDLDKWYNQDLKVATTNCDEWDIMEVYRILNYNCVIRKNLCKPDNLIWKRKEVTELTMQEIADVFGVSINDLRIKE